MAKIIFLDNDGHQEPQEHEARAQDTAELFRLAETLSDTELERMARAISNFPSESLQNPTKN